MANIQVSAQGRLMIKKTRTSINKMKYETSQDAHVEL